LWGHVEDNDYYDESKTVEDIVFAYGLDSGCSGSEELDVRGITIEGWWQTYDSSIRFLNCVFRGGGGDGRLTGGHRNNAMYFDCTFKDARWIASFSMLGHGYFQGGSVENVERPFRVTQGSFVSLADGSQNLITKPPKNSRVHFGSEILNHPKGVVQNHGGEYTSQGEFTFEDDLTLVNDSEESDQISIRNEDGQLVAVDASGNKLGTLINE
jgi:hypothetical protein